MNYVVSVNFCLIKVSSVISHFCTYSLLSSSNLVCLKNEVCRCDHLSNHIINCDYEVVCYVNIVVNSVIDTSNVDTRESCNRLFCRVYFLNDSTLFSVNCHEIYYIVVKVSVRSSYRSDFVNEVYVIYDFCSDIIFFSSYCS